MTLKNVAIGIIPTGTVATVSVPAGFDLLDERDGPTLVTVEVFHANLVVTDPSQVADYERAWAALNEMAVQGGDAETVLGEIRSYERGRSSRGSR